MIQDLSESWCTKGTGESITEVDLPVLLVYHDPDRSWITDPDLDHPKGMGLSVEDCYVLPSLNKVDYYFTLPFQAGVCTTPWKIC